MVKLGKKQLEVLRLMSMGWEFRRNKAPWFGGKEYYLAHTPDNTMDFKFKTVNRNTALKLIRLKLIYMVEYYGLTSEIFTLTQEGEEVLKNV